MELRPLGSSDLRVSALGMGCVKLGSATSGLSRRESVALVHCALDAGVRLFDTADAYGAGASESVLGDALRGRQERVVVATKVGYAFRERGRVEQAARRVVAAVRARADAVRGHGGSTGGGGGGGGGVGAYAEQDFGAEHVRRAVIDSLRRLRVDRLDLLQFHGPPPPVDAGLPDVVADLVDDGLVHCFGVGCEDLASAAAWARVAGLTSVQLPFGVLDPEAATTSLLADLRDHGVGVLARGVMGGGLLARFVRGEPTGLDESRAARVARLAELADDVGVDVLQLAVWYGLAASAADAVLLGITSADQLATDAAMATAPPPHGVVERIVAIVDDEGA